MAPLLNPNAVTNLGIAANIFGVGDVATRLTVKTICHVASLVMPPDHEDILRKIQTRIEGSESLVDDEERLNVFDSDTAKGFKEEIGKYKSQLQKEYLNYDASKNKNIQTICVNAELKINATGQDARLTLMLKVVTRFHATVVSESEKRRGLQKRLAFQDEADLPTSEYSTYLGSATTWIRNGIKLLSGTSAEVQDVELAASSSTSQPPSLPGSSSNVDGTKASSPRSMLMLIHIHIYFW
ncbi:hypothetical protein FRC08_010912 [Ceratobasidium sp. 394]|nr:hypothetical protein FRC08_010912 [Ceratobasidium sp. 394]